MIQQKRILKVFHFLNYTCTFIAALFMKFLADSDQIAGTVTTCSTLSALNETPLPFRAPSKCSLISLIANENISVADISTEFLSSGIFKSSLTSCNNTLIYYSERLYRKRLYRERERERKRERERERERR